MNFRKIVMIGIACSVILSGVLSPNVKTAHGDKKENMTGEDWAAKKAEWKAKWDAMTPEERESAKAVKAKKYKGKKGNMTDEEIAAKKAEWKAKWDAMTPEERESAKAAKAKKYRGKNGKKWNMTKEGKAANKSRKAIKQKSTKKKKNKKGKKK